MELIKTEMGARGHFSLVQSRGYGSDYLGILRPLAIIILFTCENVETVEITYREVRIILIESVHINM